MPGAQVIELVLSLVVTNALAFAVVIVDERRLSHERLERAWPTTSRNAAIVAFGPLALPFHFARTRGDWRSARGIALRIMAFVLGLSASLAVSLVSGLVVTALAWAIGLPIPD